MSYRVVCEFSDAQDGYNVYHVGDEFPRHGVQVPESRVEALASENNALHKPVIVLEEEPEDQKTEQPKKTKKQK